MKQIVVFYLFITFSFTQFYNININPTGQSHLIILQETISGIGNGWEIGIFDTNGILNDGDCITEYGDVLVASGIWIGNQLDFSAIGSIDFCDIGGEQRSGFIENNNIYIRVYDPENQIEYSTIVSTFDGQSAYFVSSFYTAISEISIDQILTVNSFDNDFGIKDFSIIKLYPNPSNPSIQIEYESKFNQNLTFSIISLDGRIYKEYSITNYSIGKKYTQLSLDNIPTGLYFIKLGNGINIDYHKFIVLK
jgi:hypothetical protein